MAGLPRLQSIIDSKRQGVSQDANLLSSALFSSPKAARLCFPRDVGGRPNRQRHDGEGGIFLRKCSEAATVHNKQILDVVGLAIPIQNRTARIIPHADRPSRVTRETGRFRVSLTSMRHFAASRISSAFCFISFHTARSFSPKQE